MPPAKLKAPRTTNAHACPTTKRSPPPQLVGAVGEAGHFIPVPRSEAKLGSSAKLPRPEAVVEFRGGQTWREFENSKLS